MKILNSPSLLLPLLAAIAVADGTSKSRPDLAPPKLNITIPAGANIAPGYLFITPYNIGGHPPNRGPLQLATYILTSSGELVWSGYSYFTGWSGNFKVARYNGKDVIAASESSDPVSMAMAMSYRLVKRVQAGHHAFSDIHEFVIVDEKTALVGIHQPKAIDLRPFRGEEGQAWIIEARFQEIDLATDPVLFEWKSLEHISPAESLLPLPLYSHTLPGTALNSSTAYDYFHLNSITKSLSGNYLISARHTSTLYLINGTSGNIIWRLGGPLSNFTLGPGVSFGFQHHARYISEPPPIDIISIFDNAGHGAERPIHLKHDISLGKYIELNHLTGTATLLRSFAPPDENPLASFSQGSVQTLPNENVLINWGPRAQPQNWIITERTSSTPSSILDSCSPMSRITALSNSTGLGLPSKILQPLHSLIKRARK